jgi:hypothetical protein
VEAIGELLGTAERHGAYVDVFGRAQPMKRVPRLNGKGV